MLRETGRRVHQQRSAHWSQIGRPAPGRPGVHVAPAAAGLVGKETETCKQTRQVCCNLTAEDLLEDQPLNIGTFNCAMLPQPIEALN